MDANEYIQTKYFLPRNQRSMPIEIPNVNRVDLARLFMLLEFTVGAEIGVERGVYSEILCQQNPGVRLFCVDAWQPYRGYRDHVDAEKLERFYQQTQARLAPYPNARLVRKFSVDAAKDIPDRSLDFVYLDAAHDLCSVVTDLRVWSDKVRVGGIVAGHDYIKVDLPSLMHVPQALHAWTDAYEIKPWYVFGSQAKIDGQKRDDGRSWLFVKPEPVPAKGKIKQ
jgi:hypothetical protein